MRLSTTPGSASSWQSGSGSGRHGDTSEVRQLMPAQLACVVFTDATKPGTPELCKWCEGEASAHAVVLATVRACTAYWRSTRLEWEWEKRHSLKGLEQFAPPICGECGGELRLHENPWGKPDGCRKCTLFFEPGPVMGSGSVEAKMAGFAEAPGATEVNEEGGYTQRSAWAPLIGGSGRTFTALCSNAGVYRRGMYLDNIVKCRPPGNRTPTALEIVTCSRQFLMPKLEELKANVVVTMGDTATSVLAGVKGITNNRGVPVEGYTKPDGTRQKIFPTWHPAFIARSQHQWPFAVHDLVRAKIQSEFPELRRVPFEIVVGEQAAAARPALLEECIRLGEACIDFETTGLSATKDRILMVGATADGKRAVVLDNSSGTKQFLQAVLDADGSSGPRIELIGQNVLYFDWPFAEGQGLNIDKAWSHTFDTMVAFHLCNASYGNTPTKEHAQAAAGRSTKVRATEKDLTMIASCHTDIPYWKARENYKADLHRVCGTDVIATYRAAMDQVDGIKAELKAYGMESLYWDHVLPVHPVLHKMTKRGVKCDIPKARRWSVRLNRYANTVEEVLRQALGEPWLNVNSGVQLISLLYDKMKLTPQYTKDIKSGEERRTADSFALSALSDLYPEHTVLKGITEVRHARKMDSTYITPALRTGRYHPHFGTSKAANGRLNSWDPNGQNVPDEYRELWVADSEDEILIAPDWSQIEWRVAMVLSGDSVGLDLLARGVDTHSAVCAEVFEKRIEDVTPHERHAAKFIVYGLAYGRTVQSIADAMGGRGHAIRTVGGSARAHALRTQKVAYGEQSLEFVERFVRRFSARFAAYWRYRAERLKFARENNYLANGWGRRRWWYTREENEQYAFDPASSAAEMMIDALIALDKQLPNGATLRLTVHDEIVVNAPKSAARETRDCMKAVMEGTWPKLEDASVDRATVRKYYPNGWSCPVDIHIGPNWAVCKSKEPQHIAERQKLELELGLVDKHGHSVDMKPNGSGDNPKSEHFPRGGSDGHGRTINGGD